MDEANEKSGGTGPERVLRPADSEARGLLAGIRMLSLDVDGVLTDGGLYYTDDGHVFRKYNVKDGVGIKRVMAAGVEVAIISAGMSASVPDRAKTLGIQHVFTGVDDKRAALEGLGRDLGIGLDAAAHVGDDVNDLPLLEAVGCPIAVADAHTDVLAGARVVTERPGGAGAVREVCDAIVRARQGTAD